MFWGKLTLGTFGWILIVNRPDKDEHRVWGNYFAIQGSALKDSSFVLTLWEGAYFDQTVSCGKIEIG